MKKILLFVITCAFSIQGFSQDTKYGVRAGLNISNLDLRGGTLERGGRQGLFFGAFGEFTFSKDIAFAPELQFSSEGAKQAKFRLDYLQVPLYFKFRLSEKFHLGAGPQIGIKIHEYEDGIRNFAYSGVGGIEFKISHQLFVDARYTLGLSNVLDDDQPFEAKNSNIQFGFGFKF